VEQSLVGDGFGRRMSTVPRFGKELALLFLIAMIPRVSCAFGALPLSYFESQYSSIVHTCW
jgi:hypothetical protein